MTSEFGRVLVDKFYDEYQKLVIYFVFIPFTIYFFSTICYMSFFMISGQDETSEASRDEVITFFMISGQDETSKASRDEVINSVKESKALEISNLILTIICIAYFSVIEGL